ncbi:MAG: YciI family protein, partial [Gammaproteobacteria bacterium]
MPRYLVASYLPDDFDPSTVTEATGAAIHALTDEMEAAGVLKFACGISPVSSARTIRPQPDGKVLITGGPYTETKEHMGGFMLLDAADMEEALAWIRKGAVAFLGPVEVRQIFFQPDPKEDSERGLSAGHLDSRSAVRWSSP